METIKEIILYSSENLKGHMNFEEYQEYLLVAIFYKFLSYRLEKENNKKLFKYNINFQEAFNEENIEYYGNQIKKECFEDFGYFIKAENLYQNIIYNEELLYCLDIAIKEIEFENDTLNTLFDNVNYQNLTNTPTKNIFIEILKNINSLTFKNDNNEEFNDLMKFFMKNSYTPTQISSLLSKLVFVENKTLTNVYDATCGSCSTLLKLRENHEVINFYGQELNKKTYNMARMNMLMHNVLPKNFNIFNEDSTISKRKLPFMDTIISHPPFLKKWDAYDELIKDERFISFKKLPPKSKADYAFIETMIYHLKEDGIMAVSIPQGVLFRSNAEKEIRKNFIKNNFIDAIISLPEKSFPKNIPTCIIIFKKNRKKNEPILFIDASNSFVKSDSLNILRDEDINKIVNTYKCNIVEDKYSYLASTDEIICNDYNLNIKLYVNSYVEKNKIDVKKSLEELSSLEIKVKKLNQKQKKLIKQIYSV